MPATLGNSIVDKLIPKVDAIRAKLYGLAGTRQHAVHVVRRRWDGGRRNVGAATIVSDAAMSPPPAVLDAKGKPLSYEATPIGRDEEGEIELHEVSLTMTEAELLGTPIAANEEWYFRVTDAHGQGIRPRYYVPSKPPRADREKEIGWIVYLKRAEISE